VSHKYREGFRLGFFVFVTGFYNSIRRPLCHSLVRLYRYAAIGDLLPNRKSPLLTPPWWTGSSRTL